MTLILKERKNLILRRGVLYRKRLENDETVYQLVLLERYHSEALAGLHDDVGHPGKDRTLSLLRERFYWPLMAKDVEAKLSSCPRCILRKSKSESV